MDKESLYERILEELKDTNHICCLIDKKGVMSFSVRCNENELYGCLMAMCKNIPWAKDIIKGFAEEVDDIELKDAVRVDDTYLN